MFDSYYMCYMLYGINIYRCVDRKRRTSSSVRAFALVSGGPEKVSVVLVGQVVSIGLHSPSCQLTVSISLPKLRSDESSWDISKHTLSAHYKHA